MLFERFEVSFLSQKRPVNQSRTTSQRVQTTVVAVWFDAVDAGRRLKGQCEAVVRTATNIAAFVVPTATEVALVGGGKA